MDDRLTIDKLNDTGCRNMLYAMCKLLARDFRRTYAEFLKKPDDKFARRRFRKCREAFLSDYFFTLTNLNGREIVELIEAEFA